MEPLLVENFFLLFTCKVMTSSQWSAASSDRLIYKLLIADHVVVGEETTLFLDNYKLFHKNQIKFEIFFSFV